MLVTFMTAASPPAIDGVKWSIQCNIESCVPNRTYTVKVLSIGLKLWESCSSSGGFVRHFSPSSPRLGSCNRAVLLHFGDIIRSFSS